MRALEEGEVLRLHGRKAVRVTCLFGVVWITRAGDPVDHFLARGESVELSGASRTLIAGFSASVVSVKLLPQESAGRRLGITLAGLLASLGTRRAPAEHQSSLTMRVASR